MKNIFSILLLTLTFAPLNAQINTHFEYCGTSQKEQAYIQSLSPQKQLEYHQQREAYEQSIQQYIQAHKAEIITKSHEKTIKYTIPIVFHIVHEGGPENISIAQVLSAVDRINEDFQALNPDLSNTIPYFQSRIANIQIEFKLAKLDPNGNCTNGITRTFSHTTTTGNTLAQIQAVMNAHGNWPGDEYLNVFVAQNIGQFAGFAYYPNNSWPGTGMDNGVRIRDTYTGTIGTASMTSAHTLSHEIGHWLNLMHTWGNSNEPAVASNCGMDDNVADTPNTIGWKTCDVHGKTCTSDPSTYDNVQNFMEYSYCSTMFTEGQKARMWAALESTTGGRSNIWSAANLAATGVNLPATLCKADFTTPHRVVCIGQVVSFQDLSYSNVTSWDWDFQGAIPSTSVSQNPSVTYHSPGVYPVTLTVSDGSSTVTESKTAYIKVLGSPNVTPFVEGFENYSVLSSSDWTTDNPWNNEAFEITSAAAYLGSQSVVLKNFGQDAGNTDALMSPSIDLSSAIDSVGVSLTFRYAYRKRASENKEKLQVSFSKDCGVNWEVRYIINSFNLGDDIATSSWTPSSSSDWVTVNVTNITPEFFVDNFRTKFEFFSDGGNNFYLDNINIYKGDPSTMQVVENEWIKELTVYPNPATNTANLAFVIPKAAKGNVKVTTITGQTVLSNTLHVNEGKNVIVLGTQNLAAGVYLIKLNVGGNMQTKQLIIR